MTPEDTFNILRRSPIDAVDHSMMIAFNMPLPFNSCLRDTYAIENLDDHDLQIMGTIIARNHWTLQAYLTHSVIEFPQLRIVYE